MWVKLHDTTWLQKLPDDYVEATGLRIVAITPMFGSLLARCDALLSRIKDLEAEVAALRAK